ncbi:MAG: hypothetical protein JSU65_08385 [Candidatus Zixiibacteriota bacterium]|nr:MAG: hypothetical protein JSU65_08385 [candidate division Zixibacteria bacterium]
MEQMNLMAAWIGIQLGIISGIVMSLMFHREAWLGGYSIWARRLVRLAHVSYFGIAFINMSYALTVQQFHLGEHGPWPGLLLIIGAITMPVACYLAAWRKSLRHLFGLPVFSLLSGMLAFALEVVMP